MNMKTLSEQYKEYFDFFNKNHTLNEIKKYIANYKLSYIPIKNKVHLNIIDQNHTNILFYIVNKTNSDLDCLSKIKFLIEKLKVKYKIIDIKQRSLPVYTCIKGYLESTKYLLDKMDYNIYYVDDKGQNLFFYAIRSFNIDLVKYLDKRYPHAIFMQNLDYNSCIFAIFRKNVANLFSENQIKNMLEYLIDRKFDLNEKKLDDKENKHKTFKELCKENEIEKHLDEILENNCHEIENIIIENNNENNNEYNCEDNEKDDNDSNHEKNDENNNKNNIQTSNSISNDSLINNNDDDSSISNFKKNVKAHKSKKSKNNVINKTDKKKVSGIENDKNNLIGCYFFKRKENSEESEDYLNNSEIISKVVDTFLNCNSPIVQEYCKKIKHSNNN